MRTVPVALILLASSLSAQDRRPPTGAVEPFAMLLGQWEGPATIDMGPRGKLTLLQHEWVGTAAGGTVLTITGQGRDPRQPADGPPVFDAFGIIHAGRDGKPAFRSFVKDGRWLDPSIEVREGGFVWSYEDPRAGRVRYTMTMTPAGEWHEIGERSSDGQSWTPFMEMTLRRVE